MSYVKQGNGEGGGTPAIDPTGAASGGGGAADPQPGWTVGLRELYDQVVEETLPDSFQDLLARLDQAD